MTDRLLIGLSPKLAFECCYINKLLHLLNKEAESELSEVASGNINAFSSSSKGNIAAAVD
jgi:hypothetical protein